MAAAGGRGEGNRKSRKKRLQEERDFVSSFTDFFNSRGLAALGSESRSSIGLLVPLVDRSISVSMGGRDLNPGKIRAALKSEINYSYEFFATIINRLSYAEKILLSNLILLFTSEEVKQKRFLNPNNLSILLGIILPFCCLDGNPSPLITTLVKPVLVDDADEFGFVRESLPKKIVSTELFNFIINNKLLPMLEAEIENIDGDPIVTYKNIGVTIQACITYDSVVSLDKIVRMLIATHFIGDDAFIEGDIQTWPWWAARSLSIEMYQYISQIVTQYGVVLGEENIPARQFLEVLSIGLTNTDIMKWVMLNQDPTDVIARTFAEAMTEESEEGNFVERGSWLLAKFSSQLRYGLDGEFYRGLIARGANFSPVIAYQYLVSDEKAEVDEESGIEPDPDAEEEMKEALLGIMTEEEKEAFEEED